MASATINAGAGIANNFLSLSAQDLKALTNWPDALIEDYLSILRSLLALANIVDTTVVNELFTTSNKVGMALGAITRLLADIAQLEASQAADFVNSFNKRNGELKRPPVIGQVMPNDAYFTNLGVGVTQFRSDFGSTITPKIQAAGVDASASMGFLRYSNNSVGPYFFFGKSRGATVGANMIVQDGDVLGSWGWLANDGVDFLTDCALLDVIVDDPAPATGAIGARFRWTVSDRSGSLNIYYTVGPERDHEFRMGDNLSAAFRVRVGGAEDYLLINTSNGAEIMSFGNTTTNPLYQFLGTSTLTHGSNVLLATTQALADGAGANVGTLNNAPIAGDPTKWVPIDDNGTTRYVPVW